ncbi:MAG: pilus assembly protein [Acidimicrobiales bacterium]
MTGSDAKAHRSARRCSGDQGVAIIEAALIMPVFLVLVFGIFEYGVVFRDYLTAADATAEAAKIGSIQGPYLTTGSGKNADYQMLALMRQDMATIPADWIERIVIFEASAPTSGSPVDQVPTNCIIGGYGGNVANKCNVYEPYDAFLAVQNNNVGYFNCSGSAAIVRLQPDHPNERSEMARHRLPGCVHEGQAADAHGHLRRGVRDRDGLDRPPRAGTARVIAARRPVARRLHGDEEA